MRWTWANPGFGTVRVIIPSADGQPIVLDAPILIDR